MDGTIDRPSDVNMSFKHYLSSLCSPMAGPWENVVDKVMDASRIFIHAILVTGCLGKNLLAPYIS